MHTLDYITNPIQRKRQVSTLNSDIGIESIMAEKLFLGDHISYNVGDCRLVSGTTKNERFSNKDSSKIGIKT